MTGSELVSPGYTLSSASDPNLVRCDSPWLAVRVWVWIFVEVYLKKVSNQECLQYICTINLYFTLHRSRLTINISYILGMMLSQYICNFTIQQCIDVPLLFLCVIFIKWGWLWAVDLSRISLKVLKMWLLHNNCDIINYYVSDCGPRSGLRSDTPTVNYALSSKIKCSEGVWPKFARWKIHRIYAARRCIIYKRI